MMLERFTPDARAVIPQAIQHARRLGHRYVGGEHVLLAAVSTSQPASSILCAHGITPERVEEEIVRRVGLGAGAGLFGGLDRDALASIGIDIDAVRARIEASFGPQALTDAAQAVHRGRRRPRRARRLPSPARSWRRRRRARRAVSTHASPPVEATGRYRAPGPPPSGHLPFTPAAKQILELSLRESVAMHDSHIGVEHIALALTSAKRGLVPSILAAADVAAPMLRAAIIDRYRQAS
jgi:ATP-dependent Clp protease ATP-binding subunit ClpA